MKKTFSLGAVLSVATDRLLTDIGDLYKILGWMTGDSPYTHQLPRFMQECRPWLLRWFPDLQKAVDAQPQLNAMIAAQGAEQACKTWLETLIAGGQPAEFEIEQISSDDHTRKNPYDELVEMRGTDEGIIVAEIPGEQK